MIKPWLVAAAAPSGCSSAGRAQERILYPPVQTVTVHEVADPGATLVRARAAGGAK